MIKLGQRLIRTEPSVRRGEILAQILPVAGNDTSKRVSMGSVGEYVNWRPNVKCGLYMVNIIVNTSYNKSNIRELNLDKRKHYLKCF